MKIARSGPCNVPIQEQMHGPLNGKPVQKEEEALVPFSLKPLRLLRLSVFDALRGTRKTLRKTDHSVPLAGLSGKIHLLRMKNSGALTPNLPKFQLPSCS